MRADPAPLVTIGLPVYNGERHLAEALDSLLGQTLGDFELLISDNASTDRTGEIALEYAARDSRIRYERLETNVGVTRNHSRLVPLARGEFFTWAAFDDRRAPDCLSRCIQALDQDPGAVLAYTGVVRVSEDDVEQEPLGHCEAFEEEDPLVRWRGAVLGSGIYDPHYGLVRTAVLRACRPLGDFADSDRALLAELALRGRFHRIPEPLFRRRVHPGRTRARRENPGEYRAWFRPEAREITPIPLLRLLGTFVVALVRTPMNLGTRVRATKTVVRWFLDRRREFPAELVGLARAGSRRIARRRVRPVVGTS